MSVKVCSGNGAERSRLRRPGACYHRVCCLLGGPCVIRGNHVRPRRYLARYRSRCLPARVLLGAGTGHRGHYWRDIESRNRGDRREHRQDVSATPRSHQSRGLQRELHGADRRRSRRACRRRRDRACSTPRRFPVCGVLTDPRMAPRPSLRGCAGRRVSRSDSRPTRSSRGPPSTSACAGPGLDQDSFRVVTSYENMHACKPQPEYFLETAALLGVDASRVPDGRR